MGHTEVRRRKGQREEIRLRRWKVVEAARGHGDEPAMFALVPVRRDTSGRMERSRLPPLPRTCSARMTRLFEVPIDDQGRVGASKLSMRARVALVVILLAPLFSASAFAERSVDATKRRIARDLMARAFRRTRRIETRSAKERRSCGQSFPTSRLSSRRSWRAVRACLSPTRKAGLRSTWPGSSRTRECWKSSSVLPLPVRAAIDEAAAAARRHAQVDLLRLQSFPKRSSSPGTRLLPAIGDSAAKCRCGWTGPHEVNAAANAALRAD